LSWLKPVKQSYLATMDGLPSSMCHYVLEVKRPRRPALFSLADQDIKHSNNIPVKSSILALQ